MSYDKCSVCGQYGWGDRHRCPPRWRVMVENYHFDEGEDPVERQGDDNFIEVYETEAEGAAMEAFEQHESECAEKSICSGGVEARVVVLTADGSDPQWFVLTGEWQPSYFVSREKAEVIAAENEIHRIMALEHSGLWAGSVQFGDRHVVVQHESDGALMLYAEIEGRKFCDRVLRQVLRHPIWPEREGEGPFRGSRHEQDGKLRYCLVPAPKMAVSDES